MFRRRCKTEEILKNIILDSNAFSPNQERSFLLLFIKRKNIFHYNSSFSPFFMVNNKALFNYIIATMSVLKRAVEEKRKGFKTNNFPKLRQKRDKQAADKNKTLNEDVMKKKKRNI
jgi:hypothetical protein